MEQQQVVVQEERLKVKCPMCKNKCIGTVIKGRPDQHTQIVGIIKLHGQRGHDKVKRW